MAKKDTDFVGFKIPKGTRERAIIDGLRKRGTNISALIKACICLMGATDPTTQLKVAVGQREEMVQEIQILGAKISGLNDYIETLEQEIRDREVQHALH